MDRPIIYSLEQGRSFDILSGYQDIVIGNGTLAADLFGQTSGFVTGLQASPTSPATLRINIAPGSIYQVVNLDPAGYGSLSPSSLATMLQGKLEVATSLTLSTGGLSVGFSQWVLIEATFAFVDVVRANDPSGGTLPYFNAANPSQPLQGPGGSGQVQPSERQATVSVVAKYGVSALTGTNVPPTVDPGYVPLYLVNLAFGQTTITSGNILVSAPSAGSGVPSNYPQAPFIAGLLNQHHLGIPGQAPQINVTQEITGVVPLVNLPVSNTVPGDIIPIISFGTGNPSGVKAGNAKDLFYDTTGHNLYICTVSGNSATATWITSATVAGAAPTGPAGGDLQGSYPNPGVAKIQGNLFGSGVPAVNDVPIWNNTFWQHAQISSIGYLLASSFVASLTVPGYMRIPTGAGTVIVQWGFVTLGSGAGIPLFTTTNYGITFPVSFTGGVFALLALNRYLTQTLLYPGLPNSTGGTVHTNVLEGSVSLSGAIIVQHVDPFIGVGQTAGFYWLAVGF